MADFYLKRDDTKEPLLATLLDAEKEPVDLTGATVRFFMRKKGGTALKVNGVVSTLVNAALGVVRHTWLAAHTDTAGLFQGEFQATFGDGSILTFPNGKGKYILIEITEDL